MNTNSNRADRLLARADELKATGLASSHAFARAQLESLIEQWPSAWGDELQVVLYGDFRPFESEVEFPALGIRILPGLIEKSVVSTAQTVVAARVAIAGRTLDSIVDASKRVNVLLGAWTLVSWGNAPVGWWCHITHGPSTGSFGSVDSLDVARAAEGVLDLPPAVRRKVDAALFWIREPSQLIREMHRRNALRQYAAYWNAFECLVEAINILKPAAKLSKTEKQRLIDARMALSQGRVTSQDIDHLYRTVVNPGFVAKGRHALTVCFGSSADHYMFECFTRPEADERLYNIRNAINHGDVDAENPDELFRIDAKLTRLFIIVWNMCARVIPFSYPVDPDTSTKAAPAATA